MTRLPSNAGHAVLRALQRSGVQIGPDWVMFTPWFKPHIRNVLEQMPAGLRELGSCRNLLLNEASAPEYLVSTLELLASQRIVEKLLELSLPNESDASPIMNVRTRRALDSKLSELAVSNPELTTWVERWPEKWRNHLESWWYESLMKNPWRKAVPAAERISQDWCSKRIVEVLLDLELDEEADPIDRKALKSALETRFPKACEARPELKEWVDAWKPSAKRKWSSGRFPPRSEIRVLVRCEIRSASDIPPNARQFSS